MRFGKNIYHDPKATLKELKQVRTVSEYKFQFEELSNQVTGLREEWLISLFVAGLREHLKCELMLAKPESYITTVSLARLHEQKHTVLHQFSMLGGGKTGLHSELRTPMFSQPTYKAASARPVSLPIRVPPNQNSLQSP